MVPVKDMTAEFLYDSYRNSAVQVQGTIDLVRNANGETFCIISDGKRTNQKFFKNVSDRAEEALVDNKRHISPVRLRPPRTS